MNSNVAEKNNTDSPPSPDSSFFANSLVKLSNGITAYRLIVPGSAAHFDDFNPKLTIVCLHDLSSSSWIWADITEVLCDEECGPGAQVLVFDFYGRGRSPWTGVPCSLNILVTQTLELLDYLRITEPVSFLGHGMGAAVAVGFAAKYPDRCCSLCLFNTLGISINKTFGDKLLKWWCVGDIIMKRRKKTLPKNQEKEFVDFSRNSEHRVLIDRQIAMVNWQIKNTPGYLGALLSSYRAFPLKGMNELFDLVGRHSRSVLIIHSDKDPYCSFDEVIHELELSFLKGTITKFDGCGHNPMFEKFSDFATLIVDFHSDLLDISGRGKSISLRVADRNYIRVDEHA